MKYNFIKARFLCFFDEKWWACRRTYVCIRHTHTEPIHPRHNNRKSRSTCIFSYYFDLKSLVKGMDRNEFHDRSTKSRTGHQSSAAEHRGNLLKLLDPFNTLHSNNLPVSDVLLPVTALSFQHISVLNNIKKQFKHIHTHNTE